MEVEATDKVGGNSLNFIEIRFTRYASHYEIFSIFSTLFNLKIWRFTMSKKVLIVDDELGIRESLKLILSEKYELVLTDSGEQCLDILKHAKDIGIVLLDIKMPKINGLEILKSIKNDHPALPVIMITGYKSVDTAAEAAALGAQGYIVKPFKSDEIINITKKYMA